MPFDSDVALLGTGVAPLVAASHLLAQGRTVLLLNPDWDFFLEGSELPLDPLWPVGRDRLTPQALLHAQPEHAVETLRPEFPGAIELWSGASAGAPGGSKGFHDAGAPHVRSRARLWLTAGERDRSWPWERIEDSYVEASDAGLKPAILEGLQAAARFPGFSLTGSECRGMLVPKACDVDVNRYRAGLLEFVRERLGPERVVSAVSQLELMPEGLRFHAQGAPRTARVRDGVLVFWTPRLTPWVLAQARKAEVAPELPAGVRLWEQWSLISREPLDPGVIGSFGDMAVWAELEGAPAPGSPGPNRLAVLRAGPLSAIDELNSPKGGHSWVSAESFGALSSLCHEFLKWDRFSIRSMTPRAIFEWGRATPWLISREAPWVQVVPACDGPLVDVVRNARQSCGRIPTKEASA